MRLPALGLLALLACLLATASPAGAATVRCTAGEYGLVSDGEGPSVSDLRARNLPRRTSDYAPPCLVAEAIAGLVRFEVGESGAPPAKVKAMGARWYGGVYRCTYAGTAATCRKSGKPRRRVTFTLGG